MTDDSAESAPDQVQARTSERQENLIWWATGVGVILAAVGLVDGIIMAVKR